MSTPGFVNGWNTSFHITFENGWTVFTSQPGDETSASRQWERQLVKSGTVKVVVVDNNWPDGYYDCYYWDDEVVAESKHLSYYNRYKLVAETQATYPLGSSGTSMDPDELVRLMVAVSKQPPVKQKRKETPDEYK
jgi:uncharacterized protein YcnI